MLPLAEVDGIFSYLQDTIELIHELQDRLKWGPEIVDVLTPWVTLSKDLSKFQIAQTIPNLDFLETMLMGAQRELMANGNPQ